MKILFLHCKYNHRNVDMLPQTIGFVGTCIQILAILSLLAPKIYLASATLVFAPYIFPVCYIMEYVIILLYNKIVKGSWNGNFILDSQNHFFLLFSKFFETVLKIYIYTLYII